MNNEQKLAKYRESGLMPFQAHLVLDVLSATPPVRHLLVASLGTGKSKAAIFLASEIANESPNYRILIIGPAALASMYEYELNRAMPGSRVMVSSRRSLRELDAETKKGEPLWLPSTVVVMSMETARQDDVLRDLCGTTWDLVIIEEVHQYGRARLTLLKTILKEACFSRVLMITATPELKPVAALLKGVSRTEWVPKELQSWDGKRLLPDRQTHLSTVAYRRSDAEIEMLRNLVELTTVISPTPAGQMTRRILLKQASSSPLALEQTIRRLRNSLVHGFSDFLSVPGIEALDEDVEADSPSAHSQAVWQDKAMAMTALTRLIEKAESLTTDCKREALDNLLTRLQDESGAGTFSACIFCVAKATANYLRTTFAGRGAKVWLFTSDLSPHELQASLSGFRSEGGILICTSIGLTGFDLRRVETLVHYDPPPNVAEMAARISRGFDSTHYLLQDESNVLPDEWALATPAGSAADKQRREV